VNSSRGAYGLRIRGLEPCAELLDRTEESWPQVTVTIERTDGDQPLPHIDADCARIPLGFGIRVLIDRLEGTARFGVRKPVGLEAAAHPMLGHVGGVYAHWLGRQAFHAGAFVTDGGAWAVVGEREAGKSTLLAALEAAGRPIVGDDTLVVERGRCLAAARCVDLRPGAAAHLGLEDRVVSVRSDFRERLPLPPLPDRPPLVGWILLRWSDELGMTPIAPRDRPARIGALGVFQRRGAADPASLLELATLPAWELSRPRDWGALPATLDAVRAAVAAPG